MKVPKPFPLQHDDHCWVVFYKNPWAIRRLTPTVMYLWRGYEPNLQYCKIDIAHIDWTAYCDVAAEYLKGN
jgi:hypothetical protein